MWRDSLEYKITGEFCRVQELFGGVLRVNFLQGNHREVKEYYFRCSTRELSNRSYRRITGARRVVITRGGPYKSREKIIPSPLYGAYV